MLCRMLSSNHPKDFFGSEGAVNLQQVQEKFPTGVQGTKAPEALEILQFMMLQKGQKPTIMVHFYPFLTTISAQDHAKLGSGQNL